MSEETAKEKLEIIANTTHLQTAIERLESKRNIQEEDLKVHFQSLLQEMKPANLLRRTLHEVQESTPLKNNLLKVAVGLGAGYFSRKLIVNETASAAKKAAGAVLQYAVTHFIARKGGPNQKFVKPEKKGLFRRLFSRH